MAGFVLRRSSPQTADGSILRDAMVRKGMCSSGERSTKPPLPRKVKPLGRAVKGSTQVDVERSNVSQQHVTEKAFIDLILPCIDQSSADSRNAFANEVGYSWHKQADWDSLIN
ncbi:hypothetical protein V6N13_093493 [Hibiscus sabdariffa]|uniref:Uncharacterized protein n=1 Tax=Hibiscus sabdariffa TaxID=183260 RepID=A0ABR2BRK4_9ROSI